MCLEVHLTEAPTDGENQFYCEEHCSLGENYARVSFCKDNDTLVMAGERLQGLKKYLAL